MTLLPSLNATDTSTYVDADAKSAPLSTEAARHLTDAIRLTVDALHVLVHRAYVGKAHIALGYVRWSDYLAAEFQGMSKARFYQLLGQHQVITVLTEVTGEDVSDLVSEKVARDIKPHLELVTAEVADRTSGLTRRDEVLAVVAEVLNVTRRPDADPRNVMPSMAALRKPHGGRGSGSDLWYTPREAVAPLLTVLPPPPGRVWCPADVDGRSHIVNVLREAGYEVVCTDLSTGQDFFAYTPATMPQGVDVLVTNPPYSLKRRWIEHIAALGIRRFALLLPDIGLGDWGYDCLAAVGPGLGMVMLNRRVAYASVFGEPPAGNPPFSSGWVCANLLPAGQQIAFREVPRQA